MGVLKCLINLAPAVIGFFMYKNLKVTNAEKKAEDIERIIESYYQDVLLSNCFGVKLKVHSAEETELGYKVVFKLPLAYEVGKLKGLESVLNKFDDKYIHKVFETKMESSSINNRCLLIHVMDKEKIKPLFYSK